MNWSKAQKTIVAKIQAAKKPEDLFSVADCPTTNEVKEAFKAMAKKFQLRELSLYHLEGKSFGYHIRQTNNQCGFCAEVLTCDNPIAIYCNDTITDCLKYIKAFDRFATNHLKAYKAMGLPKYVWDTHEGACILSLLFNYRKTVNKGKKALTKTKK
jgi:hypothetical protein